MGEHLTLYSAAMYAALDGLRGATYEAMVEELVALYERRGRLFILGVGGGAANAAHAVNDFRKLCGIEAYAPTDGISELTARANDEGWGTIFVEWLMTSRLSDRDALFVFSVGGGTDKVSQCIYNAVEQAVRGGVPVLGVVGRATGITAQKGTVVHIVNAGSYLTTPITESMQTVVLHALVSDPRLQRRATKW